MTAKDLLKSFESAELQDAEVIAWVRRKTFYVVGLSVDECPAVDGWEAIDDPSINDE